MVAVSETMSGGPQPPQESLTPPGPKYWFEARSLTDRIRFIA